MFCSRCGRNCAGGAFCAFCGAPVNNQQGMMSQQNLPNPTWYTGSPNGPETYHTVTVTSKCGEVNAVERGERGGFGWFLLGFILGFGLITIILLCIWWRDFPNRCRSIFTGAVTSLVLFVIFIVAFFWLGGWAWYSDWINNHWCC